MGKQNDAFTAYLGRAEVLADLYNGAKNEEGVVPYFSLFKLLRKCGKL